MAAGRPAAMRSTGSSSMITPVENGRICSGLSCSSAARSAQVRRARARPSAPVPALALRSEEHTSELQSQSNLVCRLLLEKKKKKQNNYYIRNEHAMQYVRYE